MCGPCIFYYYAFSTKNIRLVFIFFKTILKTVLSHHLFLFYFKRKNKIRRKKTLNVISDKKNAHLGKIKSRSEDQVTYRKCTMKV